MLNKSQTGKNNLSQVPSCKDCINAGATIFSHLNDIELLDLDEVKGCSIVKRGVVLYQEGNRINGFYCVGRGVVKIYKTGSEGKEQIIRFAKSGDIFGYRSIISNENACSSSMVIEEAVLCHIPAEFLLKTVNSNPAFSREIMNLACRELGEANNFITDIAQKTVRERLAEIIIYLHHEFGTDSEDYLKISLTREEIANMIGTATESVIRLLSEFKSDKIILLNGRKIKILDFAGLKRIGNVFS